MRCTKCKKTVEEEHRMISNEFCPHCFSIGKGTLEYVNAYDRDYSERTERTKSLRERKPLKEIEKEFIEQSGMSINVNMPSPSQMRKGFKF